MRRPPPLWRNERSQCRGWGGGEYDDGNFFLFSGNQPAHTKESARPPETHDLDGCTCGGSARDSCGDTASYRLMSDVIYILVCYSSDHLRRPVTDGNINFKIKQWNTPVTGYTRLVILIMVIVVVIVTWLYKFIPVHKEINGTYKKFYELHEFRFFGVRTSES